MYELIPNELKQLKNWVCWKFVDTYENGEPKRKKLPVNPATGEPAKSNNPDTWSSYDTAVFASKHFDGIGFMFGGSGYFGVDIDGVDDEVEAYKKYSGHDDKNMFIDKEDNIVFEFIHTLGSYAEWSVSGRGLHIICRGKLPPSGRRKGNVEMYESGRFFIMTGDIASEYAEITDCTETVKPLHEKYIGGSLIRQESEKTETVSYMSDSELFEVIQKSKNGNAFAMLFAGNWEGFYKSQSDADMALCNMLAFWAGKDISRMDAIFRQSGLMRDKWNRKTGNTTYGEITLKKAVDGCRNVYTPSSREDGYGLTVAAGEAEDSSDSPKKFYTYDDTGNSQRLCDAYKNAVKYNYYAQRWLFYDGRKWQEDFIGQVINFADKVINEMPFKEGEFDDDDAEKAFNKHLKYTRSNKGKTNMIKEAQHLCPIKPEQLDKNKGLFNTPDGIINLKKGELMNHEYKYYITKISHAGYDAAAECPQWIKFLNDIFSGDADLIRYIQKAVGYSLTGSVEEHCAFFCYGDGRNGKSTFLNVIARLMGEYAANVQPETLMLRSTGTGGSTSDVARLKGIRFVTSVEPQEGVRLNEGLIKQLTGGDTVTASKKYENEIEFKPEFKVWMATNHKPIIRGTDSGIWSRVRLIPFTVHIDEARIDRRLEYKLTRELAGILKWAVDGCLLWQKEGLKPPKAVEEASKEYRKEMDVISCFIDECIDKGVEGASVSEVFQAYLKWAAANNEYKMSSRKFAIEFSKKYDKIHTRVGWRYPNIKIIKENIPYSFSVSSGM